MNPVNREVLTFVKENTRKIALPLLGVGTLVVLACLGPVDNKLPIVPEEADTHKSERSESFGILNEVLENGETRQSVIRCDCLYPTIEPVLVRPLEVDPIRLSDGSLECPSGYAFGNFIGGPDCGFLFQNTVPGEPSPTPIRIASWPTN